MTRGLVIGKFMPLHHGHLSLIKFAASRCDQVIVSMSYRKDDPIDGNLRFQWLNESIREIGGDITTNLIVDDFDDDKLDWPDRTEKWARVLERLYGKIDRVFSSEHYGAYLATSLHAENILFDLNRQQTPVSASLIRKRPFAYWAFIPPAVRPYFVKKVCFYGPESTGKSYLAAKLADIYKTEFVPEVAREMITSNVFTIEDIVRIGKEQTARVKLKEKTANKILICDTDLITTQVYCRHYLGVVPELLTVLEKEIRYDRYFLFDIDVPWVKDGLRDLGGRRQEMYETFKSELVKRDIPYIPVSGTYERREELVRMEIDRLLA